jgi:hypothetical protein
LRHHKRFRYITRLLACLLLLPALTPAALAQDRWFKVELLIFGNTAGSTTEQWDATPVLAYPGAARFLVEPDRLAANATKYGGTSRTDEFGRQLLSVEAGGGASSSTDIPGDTAAAARAYTPTPFVTLPAAQREFRGKAAYMQRSGRYRTLFHESWVQPMRGQANSLPIVLDRSGDTGQWPLLQGSVTIYLSRYLHITTNVWLNTTGDYLPGEWRMPAPPLGPPSVLVDGQPLSALEEASAPSPRPAAPTYPGSAAGATEAAAAQQTGPIYPFRHAVRLQQKRRMRSGEVHYIDHPMLGVVVKLTPLGDEDLKTLALAERNQAT